MSRTVAPATLAAGGVLWRTDPHAAGAVRARGRHSAERHWVVRVALAHRRKYDDWTLPKGKLEVGERSLLAAVREVREETGARVEVGRRLTSVDYIIESGRKSVAYWAMRYLGGEHTPSDEVDEIRWLTPAEAESKLSYDSDRSVLADFSRLPVPTAKILLIRHAKAGKRSQYRGEDRLRPLDKIGRRQARDSVDILMAFGPSHVVAADRVRCEQTVGPLADRLRTAVAVRPEFSDEAYADDPKRSLSALLDLAAEDDTTTAVCSQGGAIPSLLRDLRAPVHRPAARKGSLWVVCFHDGDVVSADYYSHPQV